MAFSTTFIVCIGGGSWLGYTIGDKFAMRLGLVGKNQKALRIITSIFGTALGFVALWLIILWTI
jgi:hypothetical protein